MMSFTRIVSVQTPPRHLMAGIIFASLIVGILSWRFIERPFRQTSGAPARTLPHYGFALAGALIVLAGVKMGHGIPARVEPAVVTMDTEITDAEDSVCLAREGVVLPNLSPKCTSANAPSEIALLGDSHANSFAPALRLIAARHGLGFVEMTKASCPFLTGVTRTMPYLPYHAAECARFDQTVTAIVLHDSRIKIVLIGGFWAAPSFGGSYLSDNRLAVRGSRGAALLMSGLIESERLLSQNGKRVVVLGDTPFINFDAAQIALTDAMPIRAVLYALIWGDDGLSSGIAPWRFVYKPEDGSAEAVRLAANRVNGSAYYDPIPQFCAARGCAFFGQPGGIYYVDQQHLSEAGSLKTMTSLDGVVFGARPARISKARFIRLLN
jgi:hypothetical protein